MYIVWISLLLWNACASANQMAMMAAGTAVTFSEVSATDVPWSSPGNAQGAADSAAATADLRNGEYTARLETSAYGFAIPSTAAITGIMVTVRAYAQDGLFTGDQMRPTTIGLRSDTGYLSSSNVCGTSGSNCGTWVANWRDYSYGNQTFLWNQSEGYWTPAVINSPSFGVAVRVLRFQGTLSQRVEIDSVTITVYYVSSTSTTGISATGTATATGTTATATATTATATATATTTASGPGTVPEGSTSTRGTSNEVKEDDNNSSSNVGMLAGVVSGFVVVIVVVLVVVLLFIKKRRTAQQQQQSSNSPTAGHYGQLEMGAVSPYSPYPSENRNLSNVPSVSKAGAHQFTMMTDVQIQHKLGSGQFGEVYLGIWQGSTQVALKKLKDVSELASEAAMLQSLNHPHIVRYLGIYEDSNHNQYLATEFLSKGSLDLLVQNEKDTLSILDLLIMAKHVVAGMKYLEQKKVLHRDLALRNLLVKSEDDQKYCVKVADFGLSRSTESYYVATTNTMPVKWSAPEVMEYRKYSTKSDVWSFGIVLWELFSYGKVPYTQFSNSETIEKVLAGYRMPKPEQCPNEVFSLMTRCWNTKPQDRPTFAEIFEIISTILSNHVTQFYGTAKQTPSKFVLGSATNHYNTYE